jgi:hypothetical protein
LVAHAMVVVIAVVERRAPPSAIIGVGQAPLQ